MRYALGNRTRNPGEPAKLLVDKKYGKKAPPKTARAKLPALKSESLGMMVEGSISIDAGDTIFSSKQSKARQRD